MVVNVVLYFLSSFQETVFLFIGHVTGVGDKDIVDLTLANDSFLKEVLTVLKELISDFVVAFVEGSHET